MDGACLPTVPGRVLVWGRAAVLGVVALGAGTISHVAGGGRLPGLVGMTALLVLSVLAAAWFLQRRASTSRLVLLVVAGQTLSHGLLSTLAGHHGQGRAVEVLSAPPATAVLGGEGRRTGNLHDHYTAALPTSHPRAPGSGEWVSHQVEHLVEQGPLMVVAHLCGAVALALFLALGERSLWRLLLLAATRRLVVLAAGRVLRQGVAVGAGVRVRPLPVPGRRSRLAGSQVLTRDTPRRRGPPFSLAA